ncbi:hypothetical protein GCM10010331_77280 [Streptomyces xanthochromogenes]|nr:hypothetical protein GCM10010331_77280 [Streptomyces xanthochromogenes]
MRQAMPRLVTRIRFHPGGVSSGTVTWNVLSCERTPFLGYTRERAREEALRTGGRAAVVREAAPDGAFDRSGPPFRR